MLLLWLGVAPAWAQAKAPQLAALATATDTTQATAVPTADATSAPTAEDTPILSDVLAGAQQQETVLDTGASPDFVKQLLEIATGEIGYTEGGNNLTKYGEWAGDANAAWCAEFVCWCVNQTDQRYGTQLLNVVYPNYGGQNTGRDWFITRGRFVYRRGNCPNWGYQWLKNSDHLMTKNEYIPHPGDLIFFSYNQAGDTQHVALVEYSASDAQGNVIVHVIEGNNPSSVQRNSYYLNNSQVLGFGACEDVVDTTMRSGNAGVKVEALQRNLVALGFLAEKHITGTFGSNTKAAVADFQQTLEGKTVNGIADMQTQQAIEAAIRQKEFDSPDTWLVAEE